MEALDYFCKILSYNTFVAILYENSQVEYNSISIYKCYETGNCLTGNCN
jgi:hypothetical protein